MGRNEYCSHLQVTGIKVPKGEFFITDTWYANIKC